MPNVTPTSGQWTSTLQPSPLPTVHSLTRFRSLSRALADSCRGAHFRASADFDLLAHRKSIPSNLQVPFSAETLSRFSPSRLLIGQLALCLHSSPIPITLICQFGSYCYSTADCYLSNYCTLLLLSILVIINNRSSESLS